ncbi:MAG: phasin family protein [Alphaproteobacteria bacterium]
MAKQTPPMWDMDINKMMADFKVPGVDMDALLATQRKNIEAVTAANQLAAEGMQAVARRQFEILRQTMEEMSAMATEVMGAGSPEASVAKQAELTKQAVEKTLGNIKEMSEMIAKSNFEAAEVISKRVSANLDDIKSAASKK